MSTPKTLTASKLNGRDLHLLSIEGRGICGLSALVGLKEVLRQYQYIQKLAQLPRPCDVFDLAGGSGTGGLIVILLFRLEMTVDEAITAYKNLFEEVFSKKSVWSNKSSNASLLEEAVANIIHSSLGVDKTQAHEIRVLDNKGPKCFVGAFTAKNLSSPTLFRTYVPSRHASYNCTIVEAIRATTAEDTFFPSIDIGDSDVKETFIHGGSRLNNPLKAVLQEATTIFPSQCISCVLSLGSGATGVTGFNSTSTTALSKVLKKVVNDGEFILDEVAKELSDKKVFYCRLNVEHGLQDIGFADWQRLGEVRTHTVKYLQNHDVTQKIDRLVQILNRRSAIASSFEETLRILTKFLEDLQPGESWATVISEITRIVEPSKAATETFNVQCALLQDTLESCMQGKDFAVLPDELKGNIQKLLEQLKKAFQDLPGHTNAEEDPIGYINTNIQRLLQRFWFQNHIAGNIMIHDIMKYIQKNDSLTKAHAINQNLGNLNVAPFAAYDSSEASKRVSCFKGTRIKVLNEIASWIASDDPSLPPIYVLDGVAGIGKSTIAQTVAEQTAGINALGASFFFSRSDDKRKTAKTFFPTIAYQLAHYNTDFANQINEALLHTPHAVTQLPQKQLTTLIMEPLQEFFGVADNPILIVIDALDECEHDGDALLKIFAESIKSMPRLKLFITTRPEHRIRTILERYHHLKRFHLQDIEKSVVQSDIRLYLDFHLSENEVQDRLPDLECTWRPTEKDMEILIGICGILFILASTAVKFILDSKRSDPAKQLSRLLNGVSRQDFSGSKYTTVLDSFYTQILVSAVPNDDHGDGDEGDWLEHYQIVVGTVLALQYPLPCLALSTIADLVPTDVKRVLSHLHSLVAPTGLDQTFRIHHKSFPDFVTSSTRCERRFLIDLTTRHLELGKRCLKIMDSHLKPNICNLGLTDRFKDNAIISHLIEDRISPELAYASTHWATHLANASTLDGEAERLLKRFGRRHFLAWLEVLSIIRQVETAYSSLDRICKLLNGSKGRAGIKSRELFHDGCRYVGLNIEVIKVAAGHVYSVIAFIPHDTALFRTYGRSRETKLNVVTGFEKRWNPIISVMTGHTDGVTSVTFSGDGMRVASTSTDNTVRLWDGQTGAEIAVLQGHSNWVNWVAFSPDDARLASASDDQTVRLWDGQTGTEVAVLRGHSDDVRSVDFSPDGMKLVSGSFDGTVRIWDGQTGAEITVLPLGWTNSVVYSPDGTKLATLSSDLSVRLRDSQTGVEITVLQGHLDYISSAVFSPDGGKLASTSADGTVRLWDAQTGAEINVLQGHSDLIHSVVFSPDGKKLASSSNDRTVRLWDAQTGATITVLRGHSNWIGSVAFSPDGTKLASASYDRTVRLWDVQASAEIDVLRRFWGWVKSMVVSLRPSDDEMVDEADSGILVPPADSIWHYPVTMSLNATKLASVLGDGSVGLWDCQTGAEIAVLRGFSTWVSSLVFSPDGTKLASSFFDGTVRLWDGRTGIESMALPGHSVSVDSVVFSPDGTKLATASRDGMVRLWDSQTGIEIAVLQGHSQAVNSVVFSPDGMKLASASSDKTVRLWNGRTGVEAAVLREHSDWVNSVVFSSDGTNLVSITRDTTVHLWDAQTGSKIASFLQSRFVAFTLDGSRLMLMNSEELYQVDYITGDKLSAPLGMIIDSEVEAARVPGSNLWVILVNKIQPSLPGLLVARVDHEINFVSICRFPPILPVVTFTFSSPSCIAIGCQDGRVLFLDIDFHSLL